MARLMTASRWSLVTRYSLLVTRYSSLDGPCDIGHAVRIVVHEDVGAVDAGLPGLVLREREADPESPGAAGGIALILGQQGGFAVGRAVEAHPDGLHRARAERGLH